MKQLAIFITVAFVSIIDASSTFAIEQPKSISLGTNNSTTDTQIISAEFGLINNPNSENPEFVPTKNVPLVENQEYGWVIRLKTNKPTVKWREELILPEAPAIWDSSEIKGKFTLSEDRKTSIIEREVTPNQGLIINSWLIAPGDPKGKYIIHVFIENLMVKTFEFDVE